MQEYYLYIEIYVTGAVNTIAAGKLVKEDGKIKHIVGLTRIYGPKLDLTSKLIKQFYIPEERIKNIINCKVI